MGGARGKEGLSVDVRLSSGRVDATQEQIEVASFAPLEPGADAFRSDYSEGALRRPSDALIGGLRTVLGVRTLSTGGCEWPTRLW